MQQAFQFENLALKLLSLEGKTIDDYSGWCSTVADKVIEKFGGTLVYVDGDALNQYDWCYHAVPYIDGKIHDAWFAVWNGSPEPLSLEDWLVKMFGTEDEICVTVDGNDIFTGLPQHFNSISRFSGC